MKGGLGQLMKQAQAMQTKMQEAQAELEQKEVTGQSGGGMVKIVMTCKHQVRSVSIEPELAEEDRDMLEDLIAAAVNDATAKVEKAVTEHMSGMTAGLGLPPGLKLPF